MIAIVGGAGQLGSAFNRALGSSATVIARPDLDITDRRAIHATFGTLAPEAVINCAAYTAVDRAEVERDLAFSINARAVGDLATVAADLGVPFLTFSTDYVFDGAKVDPYVESDPPNPVNVYGESKLEGERLAIEAHPGALVVRTSWLLSGTHPNFARSVIAKARQGPFEVVDDQYGRPTIVDDLAKTSLASLEAGAVGLLHLASSPTVSWYELARQCLTFAGLDPDNVEPCHSADITQPAMRPRNSALDSERLEQLGVEPLPPYEPALADLVVDLTQDFVG
jgi:dTDP-4-dehydrorhamnose reductase